MPSNHTCRNMKLHALANTLIGGVREPLMHNARIHGVDRAVAAITETIEENDGKLGGVGASFAPLNTPEGRKVLQMAINGLIGNN